MMQARLPKFRRVPDAVAGKRLTERGIEIVRIILRYRFIATSTLVRVAVGNEDVNYRHLQQLYHQGLISRFTLPGRGNKGEFIYFLENVPALREIAHRLGGEAVDWKQIQSNHEKYAGIGEIRNGDGYGSLLFIRHELMISDFHAVIEVACRASGGRVELVQWMQGASLWSQVRTPSKETLPHRPDAFFTLLFPNAPAGQQRSNFFYEADRGTTNITRFRSKLLAHIEYMKQGRHSALGVKRIRSVLVETNSTERTEQCKAVAASLAASDPLAGMLFWFAPEPETASVETAFPACWQASADTRLRTLED
jgi:hypothetical protein